MTMQRGLDRTEFTTYAVPIPSLGRTALLSGAFSLLPVFAALIWLTARSAAWPVVACSEIITTAVFFVVFIRFKLVYAGVTPTSLTKRRMVLPPVSIDRALVDHVVINRVYRGSSNDALAQLLVLDADGERLFAMNGLIWSGRAIQTIADALDVQVIVDDVPLSRTDYYEMYPIARGWYATRLFRLSIMGAGAIMLAIALATIDHLVAR